MAGMLSLLALQSVASRSAQLQELEGKLASETVCTTKYRRMVGEIGKLIDWAHSTSPLPPTLGGRTSPAGYSSVMGFGSSRCVLGLGLGWRTHRLLVPSSLQPSAVTMPGPWDLLPVRAYLAPHLVVLTRTAGLLAVAAAALLQCRRWVTPPICGACRGLRLVAHRPLPASSARCRYPALQAARRCPPPA
jgi:hypothetical protein